MTQLAKLGLLASALAAVGLACAAEMKVPLQFGFSEVARQASSALEMDQEGRVVIERNECNRVRLSDLKVQGAQPQAWVSVAFDADLGTRLFKRCVGPKNAEGRLRILLEPKIADDGLAVELRLVTAELRRSDGSTGLLTRPARLLAEKVVLPRMENIRVDLIQPLQEVDEMIQSFAGSNAPLLSQRSRLASVAASDSAVVAELALQLQPRTTSDSGVGQEAALNEAELAEWARLEDELDGFLSTVVIALATANEDRDLQLDLLAALIDARMAISRALVEDQDDVADPIRDLFIQSWDQIRPAVVRLEEVQGGSNVQQQFPGLRLTTFMAGADAISALDALGPEYGIEISRDGIRRLARMLLADDAPASFTPLSMTVDPQLQTLFDINGTEETVPSEVAAVGWLDRLLNVIIAPVYATRKAPAPLDLKSLVPRRSALDDYLKLVSALLTAKTQDRLATETRIPRDVAPLFEPLVLATAWKESCWRHYLSEDQPPLVIRSPIGAVGMMQINGRVWRGLYDLGLLESDIEYNVAAGIEILEHYLVHYALRRGEHEQPGGLENLPKATYAAYNGGPRHLSRYRKKETAPQLQAIDRSFWSHFQSVRKLGQPDVATCYSGG